MKILQFVKEKPAQIFTTAVVVGVLLFGAAGVVAQTPSGSAITPTLGARGDARIANLLDRLKDKANRELDRRLTALNHLIERINAMKRLTADQKSSLVSQVQAEISNINALKTKIAGDTDIATLRTDVQSIVKSYRVFALYIPKITIIVHADRLMDIANEMTQISAKLQTRIDKAKSVGIDTTAEQALMTDRASKIADAISQAQSAINLVMPLTPDGFPDNKTALQSARVMLQTARADLRAAHKDMQDIRHLLSAAGVKTNANLTPVPTGK